MKITLSISTLFIATTIALIIQSCGQNAKQANTAATSAVQTTSADDFEVTLDKSFYMSGTEINDLYINATITSGTVKENTDIEIVKKSNPDERITGTIYRVDDINFKTIHSASAGSQAVLYFKVNNDKKFPLSYTGDEYYLVKKGKAIAQQTSQKTNGKAEILVDGKAWSYDYYKICQYTKNNGVRKSPASMLITFTKKNERLKNTPEELLEIIIFTDAKNAQTYSKDKLEITFNSEFDGQEKNYYRNKTFTENANASISKYEENNGKAKVSGKYVSELREFTCSTCPKKKIEITFEDLDAELYDQ